MRTDAPYIARERENERKVREYDADRETYIRDGLSHETCEAGDREYDEECERKSDEGNTKHKFSEETSEAWSLPLWTKMGWK